MDKLLALLFLLLPSYLIRFSLGGLPTTLLESMIWIITIIWLFKLDKKNWLQRIKALPPSLLIPLALFILAATISIFTSINARAALGEWKAFYIEPAIIFFILIATIKTKKQVQLILLGLILGGLITSILAVYQHFTGWLVPYAFWANRNTYRVTAWYGFPNAVGLFLAPLPPLAAYLLLPNKLKQNFSPIASRLAFIIALTFIPLSFLAIAFAKSVGGLVGVAAGLVLLLFLHKKTRIPAIAAFIFGLVIIFFVLPGNSVTRQKLLLQTRSGQIRMNMWGEAMAFLKAHPFAGAGLASYQKKIIPYHHPVNGENIEIFHHQHDIFLTMWVNLGILGLVSFSWILWWFYRLGFEKMNSSHSSTVFIPEAVRPGRTRYSTEANKKSTLSQASILNWPITPFLLSAMTVVLTTGLVDSPYIKNDLSLFFWLLPALLITSADNP